MHQPTVILADYIASFCTELIALTGDVSQIATAMVFRVTNPKYQAGLTDKQWATHQVFCYTVRTQLFAISLIS
ncbi:MAG: hypothetical protein ACRCT6_09440 [Notoacmeibacter sp.]